MRMVTNFHHFVNFVCCVACFGDDGFGVEGSSRGLKNPKARKVFVFHHLKMSIGISGWVKASNKVEYMDIHWLQFLSRAEQKEYRGLCELFQAWSVPNSNCYIIHITIKIRCRYTLNSHYILQLVMNYHRYNVYIIYIYILLNYNIHVVNTNGTVPQ